jgi:IS5 family transposase
VLCARWVENPYFQCRCGEASFCHALPFDRSSVTRWRDRMGEERIVALLQESLSIAVKTGAVKPADTRQVIVGTTVQRKNVMFPTDAKLIHRARERLVRLAKKTGLNLRQTYVRVGKLALIKHQRYAHAKQFKRANKTLRRLKTYLGRTLRDISRQIAGDTELDALFKWPLYQAATVLEQRQRQRGRKIYSLHAHEVECIGKGKAHAPYGFGVKVSVATTLKRSKAASSPCPRKRCRAIHMMATRSQPSSQTWRRPSATRDQPHPRRRRLSRPQRTAEPQAKGLPQRSETPRHPSHQAPDAPPLRDRARDRPHQGRAPDGPQLPRRPSR